jgi:stress response protein SCP2
MSALNITKTTNENHSIMPMTLIQDGNADLVHAETPPHPVLVRLNWCFSEGSPSVTVDASVFLLNADGMVRNNRDWVCYYQPNDLNGAVLRQPPGPPAQDCFQVTLSSLSDDVQRLLFCLTLENTAATPMFNAIAAIQTQLFDVETGTILINHHSHSVLGTEHVMVAEPYRDGRGWAFRSVDQSFAGRLVALAAHFGVRMAAEALPPSQAVTDQGPVQPVSGQNQDCTCRITLMLSKAGMTGCELLVSLWQEKMALNPNSLIINLLNEDPIYKVRMMLMREHGCPMTTIKIQGTIKRELLR